VPALRAHREPGCLTKTFDTGLRAPWRRSRDESVGTPATAARPHLPSGLWSAICWLAVMWIETEAGEYHRFACRSERHSRSRSTLASPCSDRPLGACGSDPSSVRDRIPFKSICRTDARLLESRSRRPWRRPRWKLRKVLGIHRQVVGSVVNCRQELRRTAGCRPSSSRMPAPQYP